MSTDSSPAAQPRRLVLVSGVSPYGSYHVRLEELVRHFSDASVQRRHVVIGEPCEFVIADRGQEGVYAEPATRNSAVQPLRRKLHSCVR